VEPLLDGSETDGEALSDLGLRGLAGECGGDDAAPEVEGERSGHGRKWKVRALKPPSYPMVL
jgi:hypothetical protein